MSASPIGLTKNASVRQPLQLPRSRQSVQDVRTGHSLGPEDLHALPQRSQPAFLLALLAALFWGLLPLALQIVVPVLDTYTIIGCRFLVAGTVLGVFHARRQALPRPWLLAPGLRALMPIAIIGLTLNYTLFVVAFTAPHRRPRRSSSGLPWSADRPCAPWARPIRPPA